MFNIQVHKGSIETIKPSLPTPHDKKSYKLCFMDQFMPSYYITVILFYNTSDGHKRLPRLKESLSQTLVEFYPFAGRIKDNISIDCNDEGIPSVEAQVDCSMSDFLKDPDVRLLHHFLPCKKDHVDLMGKVAPVVLQVTIFSCGALAIGGCFNHKVMDGASIGCFLKYWAASLRSANDGVVYPDFENASKTFPPGEDISAFHPEFLPASTDNMCILKRFVFDTTAIEALMVKARSKEVPQPTRAEVVSAFIWKHAMTKTTKLTHGHAYTEGKSSFLTHFVNIRKQSLLPKGTIGCLILTASAQVDLSHEKDQELNVLVGRVHEAILGVNEEYVKLFHGENAIEAMWDNVEVGLFDKEAVFLCSSWCKLGIDDVDFGWGRPLWVSPYGEPPTLVDRNTLILLDINGGEGIEAWLVLQEQEISALERDEEFLALATPVAGIPMLTR